MAGYSWYQRRVVTDRRNSTGCRKQTFAKKSSIFMCLVENSFQINCGLHTDSPTWLITPDIAVEWTVTVLTKGRHFESWIWAEVLEKQTAEYCDPFGLIAYTKNLRIKQDSRKAFFYRKTDPFQQKSFKSHTVILITLIYNRAYAPVVYNFSMEAPSIRQPYCFRAHWSKLETLPSNHFHFNTSKIQHHHW